MTLGAMTWTCLLLTAAAPPDVWPLNSKEFQIPIHIDGQRRAEIRELDLYVSHDQGQTWNLEARVTPDKEYFPYVAREDGPYWFTVVEINVRGQQTPADVHAAPVGERILVDTVRPDVKMSAERQGDTIKVNWAITEEHPKPDTLKLEYGDSANGPWTNVAVTAGPTGHAEFQTTAAVTVRMEVQDTAGNQGLAIRQVPAVNGGSTTVAAAFPPPPPPMLDSPGPLPPPTPAPIDPTPAPPPSPSPAPLLPPPPPQDHTPPVSNWTPPVRPADAAPPLPTPPLPPGPDMLPQPPTPPLVGAPLAAGPKATGNQVVAYSQPPTPAPLPPAAGGAYGPDSPAPTRGATPAVQIVNHRMVKLEFDVGKFGPSGLGGVEVYVTTSDGATWEQSAVDPNAMLPGPADARNGGPVHGSVTVQLNEEGVTYGYCLVVKSKAGLGRPAPQPGEAPQIRVELDATPPDAQLYKIEPDPSSRDALILSWKATDKHLANNPITLEWSAQPGQDGPWNFIGAPELPNTGKFTWRPGPTVPPNIYLRLTVRDTAGNKAVAQTPDAQLIDLSVPEVSNIGLGGVGGPVSVNSADPR